MTWIVIILANNYCLRETSSSYLILLVPLIPLMIMAHVRQFNLKFKGSRSKMICEKAILKYCIKFTGRYLCHKFLFEKDADSSHLPFPVYSCFTSTAWKVSVFGVILVRIFPHSDWIQTPYLSVFSPTAGKYRGE